jgi:hypothetical protein
VSVADPATALDPGPAPAVTEHGEPPPAQSTGGTVDAGEAHDAGVDSGKTSTPTQDSGPAPTTGTKPAAGEVLISEIMYNPSGSEPDGEWIEVYNASTGARTLTGLTLRDGAGRVHSIGGNVVLAAGQYGVLVRSRTAATAAKIPAAAIVYEYGAGQTPTTGILLANGTTGSVALLNGSTTITSAMYGSMFSGQTTTGRSVQLKVLTQSAQQTASSWCVSATAWAAGAEMGTPGAASDCP